MLFTRGTVVTADGSFGADVLVEGEKIVAVGTDLSADGAEVVDASGRLVMPGFIDAHTHMDMPFGGTMTADDWATGTAAAVAGGTTMIIDFALQEEGGTLAGAVEAWTEKAKDKALIDYGFHVAITDLRDDVKLELPSLAERGVLSVKIFMAYKGTPSTLRTTTSSRYCSSPRRLASSCWCTPRTGTSSPSSRSRPSPAATSPPASTP